MSDTPVDKAAISSCNQIQELAEVAEDEIVELALLRLEAEELSTKHRNKCKRTDC